MCAVITPVAMIIQSINKIVKFIENVILSQNMENYYSEEKIELYVLKLHFKDINNYI